LNTKTREEQVINTFAQLQLGTRGGVYSVKSGEYYRQYVAPVKFVHQNTLNEKLKENWKSGQVKGGKEKKKIYMDSDENIN